MTFILRNRVRETSTSTGTGDFALAGAVSDHQRFSAVMVVGDTCWYAIVQPGAGNWEVGLGTYSALNTLTRTTVIASSNAGALVSFSAGSKDVFIDQPAEFARYLNHTEVTLASAATVDLSTATGPRVSISGTTGISSFGTGANLIRFLRFQAATPITHNGTTLICPGGASFTTAAGDTAIVVSDISGNWRFAQYQRAAMAAGGGVPAGTLMLFQQTSAPIGWTKQTTHNDKALRVVSGAAGSGGVQAFSTVFARTATDPYTMARSDMPNISLGTTISGTTPVRRANNATLALGADGSGGFSPYHTGGATTDNIALSGSATPTIGGNASLNGGVTQTTFAPTMDIRVQYVDLIIASKDA